MLGRLARWLRTLGYDTAYDDGIADADLVRRAFLEARTILTRDRRLPREWRIEGCLVLESERPLDQLGEVVGAFQLAPPARPFTRCRVCNARTEPVPRGEVAGRVPGRVYEAERSFSRCVGCGRIYWEGSHTRRMRRVLGQVFRDS
jgi:uncharacterized protein with PIN domain